MQRTEIVPSIDNNEVCEFKIAGRIRKYLHKWKTLTNDPYILEAVKGYKLEFGINYRETKLNSKESCVLYN